MRRTRRACRWTRCSTAFSTRSACRESVGGPEPGAAARDSQPAPGEGRARGRVLERVQGTRRGVRGRAAYLPGDDVRSIDWRVTARTGTPYVRRYVEERERTVLFLVDHSASDAFGTRRQ